MHPAESFRRNVSNEQLEAQLQWLRETERQRNAERLEALYRAFDAADWRTPEFDRLHVAIMQLESNPVAWTPELELLRVQVGYTGDLVADIAARTPAECNCVLPSQSCAVCRSAAVAGLDDDEIPF